ncbi:MAG: DUF6476 family protein [Pseudomonadota bacterium]
MSSPDPDPELTPQLAFLRRLVTVLTATMISGVLLIAALLVIRLMAEPSPLALPEGLALPGGTVPEAVTFTQTRVLIVAGGNQLYVFNRSSGALLQTLALD